MYNFIQAISFKVNGKPLEPKEVKRIAKLLFKRGIEVSEETVKSLL